MPGHHSYARAVRAAGANIRAPTLLARARERDKRGRVSKSVLSIAHFYPVLLGHFFRAPKLRQANRLRKNRCWGNVRAANSPRARERDKRGRVSKSVLSIAHFYPATSSERRSCGRPMAQEK